MKYKAFDHGVNIITLEKNHQKMAMTCAWAMQVDYDKILCLLGSQSVTGNTIKKGDYIGISVLGISQKEIAEAIGDCHSNEVDKFATYHFENYLDVMVLKDSPIVLKCRVPDVISLEGIEEDHLIYAQIISSLEQKKERYLHMSDYDG